MLLPDPMRTESEIPRLRHREDRRTLGFVGLALVVFAGNWTGLLRHPATFAASIGLAFICCIAAHNQMHAGIFHGKRWNRLFQLVLMFGSGQPPTGIITAHNERHHREQESPRDFVRSSLVGFRWNWLNLLVFPFASIAEMYRCKPNDLRHWKTSRPRLYRTAILERLTFYTVMVVLAVLDFRATVTFLMLPWLLAQLLLVGINLLQHQDCDHESEINHSRNVTGRLTNWLLLNNGYHTAHHLRPALHWSLLPEFHRLHVKPRINPALDHRSLLGLLVERICRTAPSDVC